MTLKEWVKSLADRIQKIEDTGGGGGVTPEYVDTKVGALRTQLQGQIDSTNTVVDGHTTEIDALTSTVDSLTDDVMDNRTDINALQSSMTAVQQGVASVQSTVNGHTQMIAQLGGQVEQNTTDIGNAVSRIEQNESDISQLNNTLTVKDAGITDALFSKKTGHTVSFTKTATVTCNANDQQVIDGFVNACKPIGNIAVSIFAGGKSNSNQVSGWLQTDGALVIRSNVALSNTTYFISATYITAE